MLPRRRAGGRRRVAVAARDRRHRRRRALRRAARATWSCAPSASATTALDVLASDDALGPLLRTLLARRRRSRSRARCSAPRWPGSSTRTDLPGAARARASLLALPLVIPSFVGAFALMAAFAPGGLLDELFGLEHAGSRIEGFWGAFPCSRSSATRTCTCRSLARLSALPPALEESARALGRSPGRGVPHASCSRRRRGAIAAGTLLVVPLRRERVRRRVADALRHADPCASTRPGCSTARRRSRSACCSPSSRSSSSPASARSTRRRAPLEAPAAGRRALLVPLGRVAVPALGARSAVARRVALVAPVAVLGDWASRGLSGGPRSRARRRRRRPRGRRRSTPPASRSSAALVAVAVRAAGRVPHRRGTAHASVSRRRDTSSSAASRCPAS